MSGGQPSGPEGAIYDTVCSLESSVIKLPRNDPVYSGGKLDGTVGPVECLVLTRATAALKNYSISNVIC